jgi:putative hydrolase of the HAD superfamily
MKIKTISFDLWGTLIKANPEYKNARVQFLKEKCNKTEQEIKDVFAALKKDVDDRAERHGLQFNNTHVNQILLDSLDISYINLSVHEYIKFASEQMIKHPPILMDEARNVLFTLKNQGYRLMVASNVAFTSGGIMRMVLEKLGIKVYFYDFVFSDETLCSKPSVEFFKELHQRSHTLASQILHLGDNHLTDMNGARNYGMQLFHTPDGFNNPQVTANLLNVLEKLKN